MRTSSGSTTCPAPAHGRATALIAGGGIAGSATGIALALVGVDAVIYDARDDPAQDAGGFLTVATNGVDALRALGADAAVLRHGFATPEIVLRGAGGKQLGRAATGVALTDGTMSQTIKRGDLYTALAAEARAHGVPVEYGRRLVDARRDGDRVVARFADGTEAAADMLIGADGVHSAVRRVIDPAAPTARYEGLLTTAGYVRGVDVAVSVGSYEMIFGRRAFFGYVPAPNGETWWFANLPRREPPSPDRLRSPAPAQLRALLLEAFAGDAGPAGELVRATPQPQPLTPLHTVPNLPRWHRGPIVVIGDAAHAPSPTSGQGASLSIEDAVALASALRRDGSPETAFAAFEADRRRRVQRIVRWASRMNNSKVPGPVGRRIRDAVMPAAMRLMANGRSMRMPFDHHAESLV